MRHRGKMRGWLAAAAAVCIMMAGCGVRAGSDAQSSVPSTETATQQQTETEPETEKPTHPMPDEIEPFPEKEPETLAQEMDEGNRIILMTDIHYLARSLTDGGEAFRSMVDHGDGKLVNYVPEITDAAFAEILLQNPNVLILSGDLTLEGEKDSHVELAGKLKKVEEAGVPVLVIPGNHDINNPRAAGYAGRDVYPAGNITADDFTQIYRDFGYDEAYSRDSYSLSYTYQLDDRTRLLMLDSCQYAPRNLVGGMIKTETYEWIEQQLAEADRDSMAVLPVAHHNLLDESRVYVQDCTIEHSGQLIDILEGRNIPLFLSGHLHVQHFMQHEDIGIHEIVTSSLSTPPCQYGVLEYNRDESFSYHTKAVDVEEWARRTHSTDENLLGFGLYSPPTLNRIFYNQAYDAMKDSEEEENGGLFVMLKTDEKQKMAQVYADINAACYAGKAVEVVDEAKTRPGYKMWEQYCYPQVPFEYLEYIVEDAVKDYNQLESD